MSAAAAEQPSVLPGPLARGTLVRRYKRFFADVELSREGVVTAHCPNPGSMRGMGLDTRPDALLSPAPPGSKRKLYYRLEALQVESRTWVGCNTQAPNGVVGKWLEEKGPVARRLFGDYTVVRREVTYGSDNRSRVDFLLEYETVDGEESAEEVQPYYVEVKNVTMAWDDEDAGMRVAVFPDSKTERGQKHLMELADVVKTGAGRACVLYFVNRTDAAAFAPCTIDKKYVEKFEESREAGVMAYPLEFALHFDEDTGFAHYEFSKELSIHPVPGP